MVAQTGSSLPAYYLKPGEVYLTREPALITTILGSCISVTMYDTKTKFAVICHAVMPSAAGPRSNLKESSNIFQYVDTSIEWMIEQFTKNMISHSTIEVKLFGGSEMFSDTARRRNPMAVGKKNVKTAIEILRRKHLRPKAWNVGGNKGRKLIFNTATGDVFAKFVNKSDVPRDSER